MIWKIVLVLGVAVGVYGGEEAVSEQRVTIHHPKPDVVISHAEDKQENHRDYAWSYPSYEFSYKVKDPHTHDIKGQTEERDGDKVKGDYWLIEPTGLKRTVKYHADDEIGFNAHVDYSKTEYSLKEKDQNNQVEDRRSNSKEDEQLKAQKNDKDYEVTEGYNKEAQINTEINNSENESNGEKGEIENSGDQIANIQEQDILKNQAEENENKDNNENMEIISDAIVNSEPLNEYIEPQDNCKCNEHQNDYRSNKNEVKNHNGGQEMRTRKKRKNVSRSINVKSRVNRENPKHVDLGKIEKNTNKKNYDIKKNSQTNNLNDRKNNNNDVNFGNRNDKQRQFETRDHNKYEEKPQNKNAKIEEIKQPEKINESDNDHKYQHRILIHHPKIVAANKKS